MLKLSLAPVAAVMLAAFPAAAHAEERGFCASMPGIGSPPCTVAPGQVMIEVGAVAWDHTSNSDTREDTLTFGDAEVRVGIDERTELQFGLTSYVHGRERDRGSGQVTSAGGLGDARLGVRHGLAGPNGPVAMEAFVTLPVGHGPGTAGDWGAGALLPVSLDLPGGFALALTPELDAAVDSDGNGRHLAYGNVVGLSHDLVPGLAAAGELAVFRDNDPAGHATDARAAASLAWMARPHLQFDVEADKGLTDVAPDFSLIFGVAVLLP